MPVICAHFMLRFSILLAVHVVVSILGLDVIIVHAKICMYFTIHMFNKDSHLSSPWFFVVHKLVKFNPCMLSSSLFCRLIKKDCFCWLLAFHFLLWFSHFLSSPCDFFGEDYRLHYVYLEEDIHIPCLSGIR